MFEKISRRDFIKGNAATIFSLAATNFFPIDVHAAETCKIKTRYGIYNSFVDENDVQTWLGIPYAKPPVKNLRWRAPEKLETSDKEFSAKKSRAAPMQEQYEKSDPLSNQSENCLTLNIWRRSSKNN